MKHITKLAVAGFFTASALTFGAGASVAAEPSEPCAKQAAQVAKAEDALARVTAVFEAQPTKEGAKAKKAQQQRLAKARNRLENCLADQPV
jgi:hypothetical protein